MIGQLSKAEARDAQPSVARQTVGEAIARARRQLAGASIAAAGLEARLLTMHVLGCQMATLIGYPERTMYARAADRLEDLVRRRAAHEPLAYLLGEREFWSLAFRVTPATLIPRPESETLIEVALKGAADPSAPLRILDLGTGSGCLLLSLLSELPNARGIGVDLSQAAIVVASDNALRLGLAERAAFVRSDWAAAISGRFDIVVCNPPYIADAEWADLAADIRAFEPALALLAGPDGLDAYWQVLPELPRLLCPGGSACLEIGAAMAPEVTRLAADAGLQVIETAVDLEGRPRCLRLAGGGQEEEKNSLGNKVLPV